MYNNNNMSDNESDYAKYSDKDSYSDSNSENENIKSLSASNNKKKIYMKKSSVNVKKSVEIKKMNVPIEGITYFEKIKYGNTITSKLQQCDYCQRFYTGELIIPTTEDDVTICQHCHFTLYYDLSARKEGDEKYANFGISVSSYILNFAKDHNVEKCTKKTNMGGCFLCEYRNGFIIEGINNPELIYKNTADKNQINKSNENKINNDIVFNDYAVINNDDTFVLLL